MQESTRKEELLKIAKDSVSAQVIVDDIIHSGRKSLPQPVSIKNFYSSISTV